MFVYHYRIFDRHDVEVVSLAVLSDDDPKYRPTEYRTERWGCKLSFQFPMVKVLDYGKDWDKLERDPNPFALVVMAHLKAQEVKDGHERKRWKLHLIRLLFKKGYEKKDILELFRFIDWLLALPDFLEDELNHELVQMKEDRMPYITSVERYGRKVGRIWEVRENILEAIDARFQVVPEDMAAKVKEIRTRETLKALHREAITCKSIDAFREAVSEASGS